MNWLTSIAKPKIATKKRRELASNVWRNCSGCGVMLYAKDLKESCQVCTKCGHHMKISVDDRLAYLLDEGFETLVVPRVSDDPLEFKDSKKYNDRLVASRKKTEQQDGCRVLSGHIDGEAIVVAMMDFSFMGGSMGRAVGEAIVLAAETAVAQKKPFLMVTTSGGARMQEGVLSLMQMARTTAAIQEVKEAGLPYFVLLTDPTTGGVTASFAMLGDVTLAEPGATIGFAGARVIEQTTGETLPEGFQTAEFLQEHGMVDVIVPRAEQRAKVSNLIRLLMHK
ncbi:MAG: acetyl-CoA carboxylase, carboxyltransferase subunit beta [Alphaproteobacteria bacterium]|nr:acetyl-CoA carboxylase, carboxyltransferase subunit beta [Alphaproteobacteria bacterium]MDD9920026.1 acetyl-CoA carboxylase, carboxyltransferase subunit beta [Alphaproteobacteria bacterium]